MAGDRIAQLLWLVICDHKCEGNTERVCDGEMLK